MNIEKSLHEIGKQNHFKLDASVKNHGFTDIVEFAKNTPQFTPFQLLTQSTLETLTNPVTWVALATSTVLTVGTFQTINKNHKPIDNSQSVVNNNISPSVTSTSSATLSPTSTNQPKATSKTDQPTTKSVLKSSITPTNTQTPTPSPKTEDENDGKKKKDNPGLHLGWD